MRFIRTIRYLLSRTQQKKILNNLITTFHLNLILATIKKNEQNFFFFNETKSSRLHKH